MGGAPHVHTNSHGRLIKWQSDDPCPRLAEFLGESLSHDCDGPSSSSDGIIIVAPVARSAASLCESLWWYMYM